MVYWIRLLYYKIMAALSGKPTGFSCLNCRGAVLEFEEGLKVTKEGDLEPGCVNECFCTRGLYKTNLTRDALAKNFWKRK